MLFSIVIPVYNVEKYLAECMESILQQLNTINYDCEILLIDDGSSDNSAQMCDLFYNKYPKIVRAFHKKNEGLLATRRYGYKRVEGEYIINCDSDDLLESDMLLKIKNNIEKYDNPDVLLFNYNYMVRNNRKKVAYKNIFSEYSDALIDKKNVLEMFLKNHSVVSICTKVYKKKCIDIYNDYTLLYNISNGEDSLQSIELYNNAKTFVYINDELYNYRIGSGMTRKFDKNYYFWFKTILQQIKNQEKKWQLGDFRSLFAIKVLQTAARSITQSRYNKWNSYEKHKVYLKDIREDELVKEALFFLRSTKSKLQKDHYYLLLLFKYKLYFILCILLYIKNIFD